MKSFFGDLFYAIKTGDGKAKAFYIIAFAAMIIAMVGCVGGLIGGIVCVAAGNFQALPFILAAVGLVLTIVVFVWLNKLRTV